jgi:hypothetical protein
MTYQRPLPEGAIRVKVFDHVAVIFAGSQLLISPQGGIVIVPAANAPGVSAALEYRADGNTLAHRDIAPVM